MRFVAVLNEEGGTLRTTDLEALEARIRESLGQAGHTVEVKTVSGPGIVKALDQAAADADVDVVMAGGGDGTISAAAARLRDSDKVLAVLPAGTMNLFARSLGIPLALDDAIAAFREANIRSVDIATANGQPFVHQFSIGMHPRMIQLRSEMDYASRLGKIRASARAAYGALMEAPNMTVALSIDGAEIIRRTTGVGITNNLFGEGHLPYAEKPDGGVLGVYVTIARRPAELVRFMYNMARGRWRDNQHVEIHQANKVRLEVIRPTRRSRWRSALDGELMELERVTELQLHPRSLKVLVPAQDAAAV